MSTTVSCGQCGAPLRPDQAWCSICYAQVTEPFDPLTAPIEELLGQAAPVLAPSDELAATAVPELTSVKEGLSESSWEPSTPSESVPSVPEADDGTSEVTDLDVMFSMLAAEHRRGDPTALFADRMEDKSTRIAVMVGGTLIVAVLAFVGLLVCGAIF